MISLSFISIFLVSMTLQFSFTIISESRTPVSDLPLANTLSMSCLLIFVGYWSVAFNLCIGVHCYVDLQEHF